MGFRRTSKSFGLLVLIISVNLMGCTSDGSIGYYRQAIAGQWQLLSQRRNIEVVLQDKGVTEDIKHRLIKAQEITRFARENLNLPVDDTFSSYVDIGRPYVVWNVFSAKEFSLAMETFCFPIAGCVAYKGFFSQEDASGFANQQAASGLDVYMGGVAAYSTLGWFADPLLNTFIQRSDTRLASLIFHELAHKVLYLPGDTTFNESFATAVERYALKTWLGAASGSDIADSEYADYLAAAHRRAEVTHLILAARADLEQLYARNLDDEDKRTQKSVIVAQLKSDYLNLKDNWSQGNEFEYWMGSEINNAKIGAIGAYHEWVAGFSQLLDQSGSFDEFIKRAEQLSELPESERKQRLISLTLANTPS